MEPISTSEAYNNAIKVVEHGSDLDFIDTRESFEHGWEARIEVVPNTRNKKYLLYIRNNRFGFQEAKMSVAQWKKIEKEYSSTYLNSYKTYDCTYDNVKACLSLLLLNCSPKNFSDYPAFVQDKWVHLGFNFCLDLFVLMQNVVEKSEWKDWAQYWKNEYNKLARWVATKGLEAPSRKRKGHDARGDSPE